jgi:hypothetical protein
MAFPSIIVIYTLTFTSSPTQPAPVNFSHVTFPYFHSMSLSFAILVIQASAIPPHR